MNKNQNMLVLNLVLMAAMLGSAPLSTKLEVSPQQNITPLVTSTPNSPVANNLCADALFPVQVGANWTYANTSDSIGNSTLTNTITAVSLMVLLFPRGTGLQAPPRIGHAPRRFGGLVHLAAGQPRPIYQYRGCHRQILRSQIPPA